MTASPAPSFTITRYSQSPSLLKSKSSSDSKRSLYSLILIVFRCAFSILQLSPFIRSSAASLAMQSFLTAGMAKRLPIKTSCLEGLLRMENRFTRSAVVVDKLQSTGGREAGKSASRSILLYFDRITTLCAQDMMLLDSQFYSIRQC